MLSWIRRLFKKKEPRSTYVATEEVCISAYVAPEITCKTCGTLHKLTEANQIGVVCCGTIYYYGIDLNGHDLELSIGKETCDIYRWFRRHV